MISPLKPGTLLRVKKFAWVETSTEKSGIHEIRLPADTILMVLEAEQYENLLHVKFLYGETICYVYNTEVEIFWSCLEKLEMEP